MSEKRMEYDREFREGAALSPEQAAVLIRERAEAELLAATALAERAARLRAPERDPHGPERDHGISL